MSRGTRLDGDAPLDPMVELSVLVTDADAAASVAAGRWARAMIRGADPDTLAQLRAAESAAAGHARAARAAAWGYDPTGPTPDAVLALVRVHTDEAIKAAHPERAPRRAAVPRAAAPTDAAPAVEDRQGPPSAAWWLWTALGVAVIVLGSQLVGVPLGEVQSAVAWAVLTVLTIGSVMALLASRRRR